MNKFPVAFVPSVPVQVEIPLQEGGKRVLSFRLTFDFNAMALAEDKLGVSMLTLNPKVWQDMSTKTASILLWAGIQGGAPTQEQEDYEGDEGLGTLRSFLCSANVGPVVEAVNEAYIAVQKPAVQQFIREAAKRAADREASPNEPAVESVPATE